MPNRPPALCNADGCKNVSLAGKQYCPTCIEQRTKTERTRYKKWNKRKTSDTAFYSSVYWKNKRIDGLLKQPWCEAIMGNGSVCNRLATERDHIIPREDGGTDTDENLQSLCHTCHSRKTMREQNAKRLQSRRL